MMGKSIEALIKPELLTWARENAGLSVVSAAKKAGVSTDRITAWEEGVKRPTLKQLRKLANIYKRPLAVFYLPEPPRDFQPLRDFRRLHEKALGIESPELRLEIRKARDRREIAIQLYEDLEGTLPEFSMKASLSEKPEELSAKILNVLGMRAEIRSFFRHHYEAFNWWRNVLEKAGVLVFQARDIGSSEMNGFSISEIPFPVIALNIKDYVRRRIFTMMHEFIHILLREGGLCDIEEEYERIPEDQTVEIFCNRVAGGILVPQEELLHEEVVSVKKQGSEWLDEEIEYLAKRYWVSREVLLRRLLIFGKTTTEFYEKKRAEYERQYRELTAESEGGFAPPHRIAISTAGPFFTKLVLNSYYQERISASELSDFLNIKIKHMRRIESEVMGRSIEFGVAS